MKIFGFLSSLFSIYLFQVVFLTFTSSLEDIEVDITSTGTHNFHQTRQPEKFLIQVENGYRNDSIDLLWLNTNNEEFLIGSIEELSSMSVDTFVSHRFLARFSSNQQLAYPPSITISPGQRLYTFAPKRITAASSTATGSTTNKGEHIPVVPGTQHGNNKNTANFPNKAPKPYIKILNQKSSAVAPKFRSLVPYDLDIWYDDGRGGVFQGLLHPGKTHTINSYEGHRFFFSPHNEKHNVITRHTVTHRQLMYVIRDPANPPIPEHLALHEKEEAFQREYYNRTGIPWIHYFGPDGPRKPPVLHMWEAKEVGQKHHVTSDAGHWICNDFSDPSCQSSEPLNFELEVISVKPKAFLVKNFFSHVEADAVVNWAKPKVHESLVGNSDSGGIRRDSTRTSFNTWLGRETFAVSETLYHRAEQVLNISRLDHKNTEDIQVVHYTNGQRYDGHYDFGVSDYPHSRYITLLLYLNDMASIDAGGETSFPKGADGKGIKVHPGKGNAVFFYSLLEDGNGDDYSLHAALPVHIGEKWLANFWVWDPQRR